MDWFWVACRVKQASASWGSKQAALVRANKYPLTYYIRKVVASGVNSERMVAMESAQPF
jgi:hypothetical protein